VASFERDEDIHARTAAEVFGVEPQTVTPEMRRIAKAINYGLSYGQTDFGLSRVLRIPREDAHRYIERYFTRYARLRDYMEASIAEARKTGVSMTLLGRRRPLPGINAKRYNERAYAERIARNTHSGRRGRYSEDRNDSRRQAAARGARHGQDDPD